MRIDSLLCGSVDAPLIAPGRHRIFQLATSPSMPTLRAKRARLVEVSAPVYDPRSRSLYGFTATIRS